MTDALHVVFDSIPFRGYDDQKEFGYWIGQRGWEGWDTPPAQRAEIIDRANSHGTYDALQWFDAREVTQKGFFRGSSEYDLVKRSDQLAATQDGSLRAISVKFGGVTRYAETRRGLSTPSIELSSDGLLHVGEYEIVHRMSDPRKYGTEATLPATGAAISIDVFHRGNFPASPLIEIPSAPSAYTVTCPGGTFTVTGATPGGTHRVDLRRARVYRDGVEMPGVGTGDLWNVPANTIWTHVLSVPGRVRIRDTWV
ncbi:hypothetical protein P2P98_03195 [Microbacterium sp. Kw_RZR3]|uniref:hypothetical protein n=1 Tax=Microbacterium sp. Kw_RZR3 TaxID=3032903 RepID=UPI0023DA4FF1|nr:hypothetical protein [Microbacterium sp. Kw_RZR3]MDF2045155.1 hypothetical protein [Microbacterium sp. Kw_RZR3]